MTDKCLFWKEEKNREGFCKSDYANGIIVCSGERHRTPKGCPYPLKRKMGRPSSNTTNMNCPHKDRPHYSKGVCANCYRESRRKYRYEHEAGYKEKEQQRIAKSSAKYWRKRYKKEPKWNAERQRKYRREHPQEFLMAMIKSYMKHLTDENKRKITNILLTEFLKKKEDSHEKHSG